MVCIIDFIQHCQLKETRQPIYAVFGSTIVFTHKSKNSDGIRSVEFAKTYPRCSLTCMHFNSISYLPFLRWNLDKNIGKWKAKPTPWPWLWMTAQLWRESYTFLVYIGWMNTSGRFWGKMTYICVFLGYFWWKMYWIEYRMFKDGHTGSVIEATTPVIR